MYIQLVGHVSLQKLLINFNGIWYRQSTLQSLDTFYLGSHMLCLMKLKYNNGKQQRVESETEENHERTQDNRLPSQDLNTELPVYEGSATNSTALFGLFQTTLRDSCW
jgi:hypothetical protein